VRCNILTGVLSSRGSGQDCETGASVSTLMAEAAGLQEVAGHLPDQIGPVKIWAYHW
jgi:hypothetical protein